MWNTPEYKLWMSIRNRCREERETSKYWHGIKMCDEWDKSFLAFYKYVGSKPFPKASLDRIDSTRDYEPGNVRWVTRHIQSVNRKMQSNNTSGYRGVYWREDAKMWRHRVSVNRKHFSLGLQKTKEEAAWMFDQLTIALNGDYARTNFEYFPVAKQ